MIGWRLPPGDPAPGTPPEVLAWWPAASTLAARVALEKGLETEGAPWAGFNGLVWPVRDSAGSPLALKVSHPRTQVAAEAAALRHWHGDLVVRLQDAGAADNWILLERLDGARSLAGHRPVDEAVKVIASIAASMSDAGPPNGETAFRAAGEWAQEMASSIDRQRVEHPDLLPGRLVDRAHATMTELRSDEGQGLLHFDLHFLNVLHTLDQGPDRPAWKAIDPLPHLGRVEWEATAMLRNRWEDAHATGDPDAALRRRVDIFAEVTGADAALTRAIAQAVAVENLLWLLRHQPDHFFVPPYSVLSGWVD